MPTGSPWGIDPPTAQASPPPSNYGNFLRAAAVRAVRTIAQTAVATVGTTALIQDVDWLVVGSASLLAGVLSLLTAVATDLPEAPKR